MHNKSPKSLTHTRHTSNMSDQNFWYTLFNTMSPCLPWTSLCPIPATLITQQCFSSNKCDVDSPHFQTLSQSTGILSQTDWFQSQQISLPHCRTKMYADRKSHATVWWVTVCMMTGQTNRQADTRTQDCYTMLSARCSQHSHSLISAVFFFLFSQLEVVLTHWTTMYTSRR